MGKISLGSVEDEDLAGKSSGEVAMRWFSVLVRWGSREINRPSWDISGPGRQESLGSWKQRASKELQERADLAQALLDGWASPKEVALDALAGARGALSAWPAMLAGSYGWARVGEAGLNQALDGMQDPAWGIDAFEELLEAKRVQAESDRARSDPSAALPKRASYGGGVSAFSQMCKLCAAFLATTVGAPLALAFGFGYFEPARRRAGMSMLVKGLGQAAKSLAGAKTDAEALEAWGDAVRWLAAANARPRKTVEPYAAGIELLACAKRSSSNPQWRLGLVRDPEGDWIEGRHGATERAESESIMARDSEDQFLEGQLRMVSVIGGQDASQDARGLLAMAAWREAFPSGSPGREDFPWRGASWSKACAELVAGSAARGCARDKFMHRYELSQRQEAMKQGKEPRGEARPAPKEFENPMGVAIEWGVKVDAFKAGQSWPGGMAEEVKKGCFKLAIELCDWQALVQEAKACPEAEVFPKAMELIAADAAKSADALGLSPFEFSLAIHEAVGDLGIDGIVSLHLTHEERASANQWIFESALVQCQRSAIGAAASQAGKGPARARL